MLQPGAIVDGRYRLRGLLGSGGMAQVHAAWDTRLEVPVALKVLSVPVAPIAARLVQEGRIQAALRHPHIVAVSDIVTVGGAPGLVMELVEGPSLAGLLESHRLELIEAEHLARGVLSGVQAAHALGLVHRDLKPANVLLARIGDGLHPKVADFGLAKLLAGEGQGTRSGMAMGTPRYMAPEQIRGAKDVDQRADVFSLGALLYELFLGRVAFQGEDTVTLFNAVCGGDFVPPSEITELPERIEAAILGCLQVEASERLPSCAAVLDVLGPAPPVAWSQETLRVHRQLVEAPIPAGSTDQSPTFSMSDLSAAPGPAEALSERETSSATFGWDLATSGAASVAPSAPSTAEDPPAAHPPAVPEAPDASLPGAEGSSWVVVFALVAGLVVLVAGGLALTDLFRSEAQSFTPEAAPRIEGSSAHQRLLDQAWAEYQANEDLDAVGHLDQALEQGASDPSIHLLRAAVAFGFGGWETFEEHVLKGAEASAGQDGPVAELLAALSQGMREDTELGWWAPTLRTHTQRHPDDWLAWVLWCAGMYVAPDQVPYDDAVVQAVMDTNPGAIGSWVVGLELRRSHDLLDEALEVGDAGLVQHPGSAALRGSYARALVEKGELDRAMEQALECLRRDAGWTPCRTTGAGLAVRKGDDERLERLVQPLTGPEADPAQAYQLFHGVAQALEGHGRPGAAAPHWRRAEASALESGNDAGRLDVLAARLRYAWSPLRADDAELERRLGALDRALADPDLPRRVRQRPGHSSQAGHALLALRDGEPEAARALVAAAAEDRSVVGARRLALELAVFEGTAPDPDGDCLLAAELALGAGHASGAWVGRAEQLCESASSWDQGAWAGVAARIGVAGVDPFDSLWPKAEIEVPLVADLAAQEH